MKQTIESKSLQWKFKETFDKFSELDAITKALTNIQLPKILRQINYQNKENKTNNRL